MQPIRVIFTEAAAAWRRGARPWRIAYTTGVILILVGISHGLAWLVVGGAWDGPVSFRKPFSFGVSFGLATLTLAWFADRLRLSGPTAWALLAPLAAANATEVAWVSLQRARGVAAHFNFTTPLDTALYVVVGAGAITVSVIVTVVMTVLAFRRRTDDPALTLAIRFGLLFMLTAVIVGGAMISVGNARADAGRTNDLVQWGAAGNMKVTHALGLHGIQVLAGLAVWLSATTLQAATRTAYVATAAVGYCGLLVAGTVQWLDGRALTHPAMLDGSLGLASIAALTAVAAAALRAPRSPEPDRITDWKAPT